MKKGGFMKDALILFAITLIAGLLLGAVYQVTKVPIEVAQAKERLLKNKKAFPEAADFVADQSLETAVAGSAETLKAEKPDLGNVSVNIALNAVDASGTIIGHIITASSDDSYGGVVKVSVGITLEGTVTGVEILEITDTPGLGMKAAAPAFRDQYKNKTIDQFQVVKGDAGTDSDIVAISGATITTAAVTHAVNAALYFVSDCIPQ